MAEVASPTAAIPALSPLNEEEASSPAPVQPSQEQDNADDSAQSTAVSQEAKDLQDAKEKASKERLGAILHSEIGVNTLLTRLKQSVASARDYAVFLKKRANLEEEHAAGVKKLAAASRSEHRQGTYSRAYEEIQRLHDRIADHGLQFSVSLLQMSEDLTELANNIERGRKQWKQSGLAAEKKVQDAEALVEKAKAKYDSLAEQYDRVRTGDKQAGKFGLKGHKSAAQLEEEVFRKVQAADSEYQARVQAAKAARQELVSSHRPQTVHNLQNLIFECDSGLTLQLQKYAAYNEKLLLGQGLCVSPLKNGPQGAVGPRSLRELVHQIDSEKDFDDYVSSFAGTPGSVAAPEAQYIRHPTLANTSTGASPPSAPPSQPNTQTKRQSISAASPNSQQPTAQIPPSSSQGFTSPTQGFTPLPPLSIQQQPPNNFGQPPQHPPYPSDSHPPAQSQPYGGPPQHGGIPQGPPRSSGPAGPPNLGPVAAPNLGPTRAPMMYPPNGYQQNLPPLNPVFGVTLADLYARDGTAVPMIVYQCIQAVELFGLDVEGIYRLSGSATHITHMKSLFDNDSNKVDFTNPENFYHDVNSVAGLLKQFFRELPDPLLTSQYYSDFVNAARIEHDIQRRDALHGIINNLPDPNYATLRALVLHLNKVQEHYSQNRMNAGNLAICFGPTLMGANTGGNIADAGWQARVIETILLNTFQIFDDD